MSIPAWWICCTNLSNSLARNSLPTLPVKITSAFPLFWAVKRLSAPAASMALAPNSKPYSNNTTCNFQVCKPRERLKELAVKNYFRLIAAWLLSWGLGSVSDLYNWLPVMLWGPIVDSWKPIRPQDDLPRILVSDIAASCCHPGKLTVPLPVGTPYAYLYSSGRSRYWLAR